VIAGSDCLPPLDTSDHQYQYVTTGSPPAQFTGSFGTLTVQKGVHRQFTNCQPAPASGTESHSFGSVVDLELVLNGGTPFQASDSDVQAAVSVTFVSEIGDTRTFATELLQLDIDGGTLPPGVVIRESPTLPSLGITTIQDLGAGTFLINSFFDVFTELSVDGGQSFVPCSPCERVELQPVPEPGTLALLALGAGIGVSLGRRRRTRS
jgi:hypothetical protein